MQRRKKQLAVTGWLLCVLLTQGFADPIRSAAQPDRQPLSVANSDGEADGFSVELLRAALAEVGMEVSFRLGAWSEITTDLAEGRLDVLPLVSRTQEREALFDFTTPYLTSPGTLFVRNDDTKIRRAADLQGRRIAVIKDTPAEKYVWRTRPSETIIVTTNSSEAFQMLSDGRADVVVAREVMGLSMLRQMGLTNIWTTGHQIEEFKQQFCFAVKKGDANLLARLNEGLAIVIAKGIHRQLELKWIHPTEVASVRNRVLVFSDDFASPPYSFLDEQGQPTGFNVELFRAVAKKVGLTVSFELAPWETVWDKVQSGAIDITSMQYPNPEKEAWVDFSIPHSVVHRAVFARRDSPPYKTPEDLKGRRIAVPQGGALNTYAQRQGLNPLTTTESVEAAMDLLDKGQVDFALCVLSPGRSWIRQNERKNLYAVDPRFQKSDSCYAVGKGDAALLNLINDGLTQLKESGEYQQIYNQWLGVLERKERSQSEEDTVRNRVLVFSDDFASPPTSFLDEQGRPTGFNVELLRAVARETGLNISFDLIPWNEVLGKVKAGKIDITSILGSSPERAALVDFSTPHSVSYRAVFARSGSPPYKTPEDLKGRRIAVPEGTALHKYALQLGLGETLTTAKSPEESLELLKDEKVDFALTRLSLGLYLIHKNGWKNLYVADSRFQRNESSYAVRKGDEDLLNLINEGLTQLKESGEYQQIYNQWLGVLERKGLSQSEEDAVRNRVLVFSDDFASPPYSFLDEQGRPTGFNVEMLRAVAKKARLTVSFKLVPWGEVPDKMKSGEADISCMHYPNPEREAWVDFSTAHSISYRAVFARRDSPPYKTPEDLKGRRISAQAGGVLQAYAQRLGERPPTTAETLEGALALLGKGQVDFSLCRLSPGRYWIRKNRWKNLYAVDPHLQKSEYCYVVQKGEAALLNLLNEGLQQVKESGEYRQIYSQWLGALESEADRGLIKKIALITSAAVTLLTTVAILIIVFLRRMVKKRTTELEASNQSLNDSRQAALNLMEDAVLAKERLELTQFAIDHANDLAFWFNSTGWIVYANEAACRTLGYDQEEILQLSISDIDPTVTADIWSARWGEYQEKKSRNFEACRKTKDGRVFPVEVYASYIKYGDKEYVCSFSHDITERKEAEKRLRFEQDLFLSFMDTLPANVYFKDTEGRFVYVNSHKAARHGMKREALVGKTDSDFFPEDQVQQKIADEERVMKTRQPIQIEEMSGSIWHLTIKAPRYDENGNIAGTFGVSWDITERHRIAEALQTSEARFRLLFENMTSGFALHEMIYDEQGNPSDYRWLQVNPAFEKLTGISAERAVGHTAREILPNIEDHWTGTFGQVAKTGKSTVFENYSKDLGKYFETRVFCPAPDQFAVVFTDVTERTTARQNLEESRQFLRTVIDSIPIRVFWKDRNSTYLGCNQPFANDVGIDHPEEVVGKIDFDLAATKKQSEAFRADDLSVIESGTPKLDFEESQTHPDGTLHWLKTSKIPLRDLRGEIIGVIGTYEDITGHKRMQTAMQESAERYRTLFDQSSDGIILLSPDGHLLSVNAAFARMHGYKIEEMLHLNLKDLDTPETFRLFSARMRLLLSGESLTFEVEHYHKAGHIFPLEVSASLNTSGEKSFLQCLHRDITERKRMQAVIRESAELFSLFMHHSPIYTYIKEVTPTESRVLQASDNFQQMIGIPGPEMAGKTMTELFPPELALKIMADDLAVVTKGEVLRTNEELNGRSYTSIKFPIVRGDRKLLAGYTTDITEEKKNQTELLRLSTAIEQSPEHVMITNPDGILQYVNPAFETITGYSREEVLGKNPRFLKSGKHDKPFYSDLWKTISSGKTWEGRFVNKRKTGELYTEEAVISAVRDPSGTVTGYVAVKRDITQELVREEKFRQSQKMDAIGQLTGGIAHDFNNVLQAILGFSELLTSQLEKDSLERQNAFEIQKAAKRAAEMVRQLLTFSRSQPMSRKRINLNTAIWDIELMLHLMLGDKAKLTFVENPALHEIYVDPGQITQLLTNLTVNARDAMPDGGRLTITTENITFTSQAVAGMPEAEPGSYVCLSAADTGCGMSREVKDHLFEPFFTTKAVGHGTGMGLSVVYGIVKQNKGWIHVDSEEGRGTTLKIYLPAAETPVTNNLATPPRNGRILLVEDDEGMSKMVVQILKSAGYKPVAVASAEEALELFKQQKDSIDMLFSDVRLPGKNGIELADILREEKPRLPVLLYSGYEDPREQWIHFKSKGYHFLKKPFAIAGLLTAVCGALAEITQ